MNHLFQFFKYEHLPTEDLRNVSKKFYDVALWMYQNLPANAESTSAMRKLLESKDCAVRAKICE